METNYEELLKAGNEMGSEGFEDMSMDVMAFPFIRVLQDLSPACKSTHADYNAEAEAGMFINSLTGELFDGDMTFVVGRFERMFLEWKPKRGGLAGVHDPAMVKGRVNSDLFINDKNQIEDPQTKNVFMDTYTYYILFPERLDMGVCLMSLSSTQLKQAKKLNRSLMTTMIPGHKERAKPFFMVWNMATVVETKGEDSWYGVRFTKAEPHFVGQKLLADVSEARQEMKPEHANYNLLDDHTGQDDGDEGADTNRKF